MQMIMALWQCGGRPGVVLRGFAQAALQNRLDKCTFWPYRSRDAKGLGTRPLHTFRSVALRTSHQAEAAAIAHFQMVIASQSQFDDLRHRRSARCSRWAQSLRPPFPLLILILRTMRFLGHKATFSPAASDMGCNPSPLAANLNPRDRCANHDIRSHRLTRHDVKSVVMGHVVIDYSGGALSNGQRVAINRSRPHRRAVDVLENNYPFFFQLSEWAVIHLFN